MGRPKKANPKNRHIGIVTTEEKFRRYKSLNLIGDQAIDVLLFHLEKGDKELNIKKTLTVQRIKSLREQIEQLEYEILQEETRLSELNEQIGVTETGLGTDVDRAIKNTFQRFRNQEIYSIDEFLELKKTQGYIRTQAYLCGVDVDEFKELVRSQA